MVNYINLDMTFTQLCSAVLTEYKEPVAGSNAIPLDVVEDAINSVYMDIFNEPEDDAYLREANFEFPTVADGTLDGDLAVGAVTIVLENSDDFPNATRKILINNREFAQYTTNTVGTETLSVVTGVETTHDDGEKVRLGYPLSSITDLDEQEINAVYVDGLLYKFKQPAVWLNVGGIQSMTYTIFDGYFFFPETSAAQDVQIIYNKELTLMTATGDKPSLIPGKFREALLVSGAVTRIGVRDDMRTGFDWHQARYQRELKKFYAFANNRIKTKGAIMRPSVYD